MDGHEPATAGGGGEGAVPSEAERCRRAAGGDQAALESLLRAHHVRLLARAARKIGVDWQGKIDPEDILQETYIEVYAALPSFDPEAGGGDGEDAFYRWASLILDHRFIDAVRRLRTRKRNVAREATAPSPASPSRYGSFFERRFAVLAPPSLALRREEAISRLMSGIARLPEDQRRVVERVFLHEEPLGVVATEMGRTEDAVRRLGSRAIERLREALGAGSLGW